MSRMTNYLARVHDLNPSALFIKCINKYNRKEYTFKYQPKGCWKYILITKTYDNEQQMMNQFSNIAREIKRLESEIKK